jgi:hypothetical protein
MLRNPGSFLSPNKQQKYKPPQKTAHFSTVQMAGAIQCVVIFPVSGDLITAREDFLVPCGHSVDPDRVKCRTHPATDGAPAMGG